MAFNAVSNTTAIDDQVVIPPVGSVDLLSKQHPVHELHALAASTALIADASEENKNGSSISLPDTFGILQNQHFAFTRGFVDVAAFKDKLHSLPIEAWDDDFQAKGVVEKPQTPRESKIFVDTRNAKLVRPAHDNWGIKKIVFTFCDDFLLKVLQLPWARLSEWRGLLLPVYHAIGIHEHQVVRSLLARLPPGVTIPKHHDTGYWVRYTHRIHVAIDTDLDSVDFLVGPTDETMRKYRFDEGRIVELNNQAKHAVVNRSSDCFRVHLIFDYVDFPPTINPSLSPSLNSNPSPRSFLTCGALSLSPAPHDVPPPPAPSRSKPGESPAKPMTTTRPLLAAVGCGDDSRGKGNQEESEEDFSLLYYHRPCSAATSSYLHCEGCKSGKSMETPSASLSCVTSSASRLHDQNQGDTHTSEVQGLRKPTVGIDRGEDGSEDHTTESKSDTGMNRTPQKDLRFAKLPILSTQYRSSCACYGTIPRRLVQPAEQIFQTRRSVDLARDAGMRKAPSFLIIGAQKCGTTSMYEYLCQHPLVLRGKRRETHYFDWRFNHKITQSSRSASNPTCHGIEGSSGRKISNGGSSSSSSSSNSCDVGEGIRESAEELRASSAAHLAYYLNFYDAAALHKHPSLMTGESTPSYLLHADLVIPRVLAITPWVQIIVMLRDPVKRAISQYAMCVDPEGTPQQLAVRGQSRYRVRVIASEQPSSTSPSNTPLAATSSASVSNRNSASSTSSGNREIGRKSEQGCVGREGSTSAGAAAASTAAAGAEGWRPMTFREVIEEEIQQLRDLGITADSSYADLSSRYLGKVPMDHGGHSIVARGLYALQLEEWLSYFPPEKMTDETQRECLRAGKHLRLTAEGLRERVKIVGIGEIKGSAEKVQRCVNGVFAHIGLPPAEIEDPGAKNTRNYQEIDPEDEQLLRDFYAPFNERLFALLGRHLDW